MGPNNNPNALGITMVFGMFSVLYNKKRKLGELILPLASVFLFAYVIILTGSRKSLLCGGLLCFVWLINFIIDTRKLTNGKEKYTKYTLVIAALTIGIMYFVKNYANTASFERLILLSKDGSSHVRMEMYRESLEFFKKSKLFGIGFNQFRVLSSFKGYAHSTYAELLADAGIFGCILYFYPIIKTGILLIKQIRKKPSYQAGMLFALYIIEIILGAAVIYMYVLNQLLIWSILYMTAEKTSLIDTADQNEGEKICQKFTQSSDF
jgi:O-antigen ligase